MRTQTIQIGVWHQLAKMPDTIPMHRFLQACRSRPVDKIPVWFMRQAGRYMGEYRALREKHDLLTLCKTPELAAEVTLQPVRAFELDAAILFTDLLIPLEPMGMRLHFAKGEGPVLENPVRDGKSVRALKSLDPEKSLPFLLETVRIVKKELSGRLPLIGFGGAPFTLASYMIEGGHSRNFEKTKTFMYSEPKAWKLLMDKLSDAVLGLLKAQIKAGAEAVQLFDSWVGALSPADYERYVLAYSRKILQGLKSSGVPSIHFGTSSGGLLELMKKAGGDVIGVDWRVSLKEARRRLGHQTALQGNLDPLVLFAPVPEIKRQVRSVLEQMEGRGGYIFNLGHGILPGTPAESVSLVAELVHGWKK